MTRATNTSIARDEIAQSSNELNGLAHSFNAAADDRERYAVRDRMERVAERIAFAAAEITGGQYREPYNGHVNRETWNASLWIDNDQSTYNAAREIVRDACAGSDYETRGGDMVADRRYQLRVAGDALRDWYAETFGPADTSGPLEDAWSYAVAVADWYRIAEGIAESMDDDPTVHA